jgi:hypothetical protein
MFTQIANVHREMRAAFRRDASEASLQDNGRRAAAFSRPLRRNLGATDPRLAASSDGTVLGIAAAKEREPTAIVPKMHVFTCTLPCSALSDSRPREDAIGVSE